MERHGLLGRRGQEMKSGKGTGPTVQQLSRRMIRIARIAASWHEQEGDFQSLVHRADDLFGKIEMLAFSPQPEKVKE